MRKNVRFVAIFLALSLAIVPVAVSANNASFIGPFTHIITVASTVPSNGDINPYGIVVIPHTIGNLIRGNILVSNFNHSNNQQGTGNTIVEISPKGSVSLFAQIDPTTLPGSCPGGVGLTTALAVLRRGWVIVGSLPTSDGTSATAQAGCLIVLNSHGEVVETFSDPLINGPWDMTALDHEGDASLFVTNVLNGTVAGSPNVVSQGTVLRIDLNVPRQNKGMPSVQSMTIIGSGFDERTDPAALVIGPTGVGLDRNGNLYVADTFNNRIVSIHDADTRSTSAGLGTPVSSGGAINGPLGLTLAPNGDILVANANDGNLVEITPGGVQVAVKTVDTAGAGTLFGLVVRPNHKSLYFVDDGTNTLNLFH